MHEPADDADGNAELRADSLRMAGAKDAAFFTDPGRPYRSYSQGIRASCTCAHCLLIGIGRQPRR